MLDDGPLTAAQSRLSERCIRKRLKSLSKLLISFPNF